MSMTEYEAQQEEWYSELERELYGQHKEEAIEEFKEERLKAFYVANPGIGVSAVQSLEEAKSLLADGHPSASLVFAVSAIEQFLKIALLKPVVHGLVHSEIVADL